MEKEGFDCDIVCDEKDIEKVLNLLEGKIN